MSFAKRAIVEDERKRAAAIQVAIRAEYLKRCQFGICDELTEHHSEDILKKAYAIGNALISKNDPLTQAFKDNPHDRKELTDILKSLWTDFSDECKCQRQAYED
jgi:hypothetical protein